MSVVPKAPKEGFGPLPVTDSYMDHIGPVYTKRGNGSEVHLGFWVEPYHCNPIGICHGGMMMSVMDTAIGINITMVTPEASFTPTISLTYDFIAPSYAGDWLESKVDWTHAARKTGFAQGFLMRDETIIVRASGVCKILRKDDPRFNQPKQGAILFPKEK